MALSRTAAPQPQNERIELVFEEFVELLARSTPLLKASKSPDFSKCSAMARREFLSGGQLPSSAASLLWLSLDYWLQTDFMEKIIQAWPGKWQG